MNPDVLRSTLVVGAVGFVWPILVKYWKPLERVPNDLIPWVNGLLFLLTGIAGPPVAVTAAATVLLCGRFGGFAMGAWVCAGAFAVGALAIPRDALAAAPVGVGGTLLSIGGAVFNSSVLGLLFKTYAQPLFEKKLGWVNWEKVARRV